MMHRCSKLPVLMCVSFHEEVLGATTMAIPAGRSEMVGIVSSIARLSIFRPSQSIDSIIVTLTRITSTLSVELNGGDKTFVEVLNP